MLLRVMCSTLCVLGALHIYRLLGTAGCSISQANKSVHYTSQQKKVTREFAYGLLGGGALHR